MRGYILATKNFTCENIAKSFRGLLFMTHTVGLCHVMDNFQPKDDELISANGHVVSLASFITPKFSANNEKL